MSNEMNWSGISRAGTTDLKLPYSEHGVGEPVVFVHGSPADHRIWEQHQKIIGSRYRAIALSQRYFGRDPWPDSGKHFSISTLANDLASFVRGLALGPVTIVGWSFGGAVCLTMAARNRELVDRMFLYEPSLTTFVTDTNDVKAASEDRSAMTSAAIVSAASGDLDGAAALLMDGVNGEDGAFDRLASEVRAMMIENGRVLPLMFAGPPLPSISADDLRALDCPITIALGEVSRSSYQIAARTAQSLLPLGRLEIVRDARHLWPIQDPVQFSGLVLQFLDRT